jgi:hypothetical protein
MDELIKAKLANDLGQTVTKKRAGPGEVIMQSYDGDS